MAARPRVLAVVPTLDVRAGRLGALCASIAAIDGRELLALTVVVNTTGVTAPSAEGPARPMTRDGRGSDTAGLRLPDDATVLETGLNLGFAGSLMFAAGRTDFTHLWLLQDDLVIDPDCLTVLLDALADGPTLGAVSPTVVTAHGIVPRRSTGGKVGQDGRIARYCPPKDVAIHRYRPDAALDFVMSRGLLVRAEAWRGIGGADPRLYPVGWTDVDLCTRLRAHGWSIATEPRALVRHEKAASTPRALGVVTGERNRALHHAKVTGGAAPVPVHPDIPRELLATVAQSASSLAFDLAGRLTPRMVMFIALLRLRARVRRLVARLLRPLRLRRRARDR